MATALPRSVPGRPIPYRLRDVAGMSRGRHRVSPEEQGTSESGFAFCAPKKRRKIYKNLRNIGGDMSRDLRPAERRVCRMVLTLLAVLVLGFLVLSAIEAVFEPSPPVKKALVQPHTGNSVGARSKDPSPASDFGHKSDPQPQKQWAGGAEPDEPARDSLSTMKVRLERLAAAKALERTVQFDPEPLQRGLDAHNTGFAEIAPKADLTESALIRHAARIASANPQPPSVTPPAEPKTTEPQAARPDEPSPSAEASAEEEVLQIKSRLHELGFLSSVKPGGWDAPTRNALRDFKVVNSLANDDAWDLKTSRKLSSETAIRADQSIIGNWSTGPCRSAKPTDTRLSISSRRARSSAGSICEFHNVKATAHEWRVRADCSHKDKHWTANGKFSLTADKLVWTSERDVISYVRCSRGTVQPL
jgi:hypothetical protein